MAGAWNVHWRVEEQPKIQVARGGRSVVDEAVMAACVHEHDLEVRDLRRGVGDFLETTVAHGGAWHDFG